MSNKELASNAIQQLPDKATLEEIIERIVILAAIQQGEQAVDEGRVISHEEVQNRVASWRNNKKCLNQK